MSLGRVALASSGWMAGSSLAIRGLGAASQLVAAWFLTKEDFGLYGITMTAAMLALALRDGGVRHFLARRRRLFARLSGPALLMTFIFNSGVALLLVAVAPTFAQAAGDSRIAGLVYWTALALPLGSLTAIASAGLTARLEFRSLAAAQLIGAIIRYAGIVILASTGWGPVSLVAPLPLAAIAEGLVSLSLSGEHLTVRRVSRRLYWVILQRSKWLLLGAAGVFAITYSPSGCMRPFLDIAAIGVFFFGSQLVIQVAAVVTGHLSVVLYPLFALLLADSRRLRIAFLRSLEQVSMAVSALCFVTAAAFPALDRAIWDGKWADAFPLVAAFAVSQPLAACVGVSSAVQQARGAFRVWGLAMLALGTLHALTALAVAAITRDAYMIAFALAFVSAATSLFHVVLVQLQLAGEPSAALKAVIRPWLTSFAAFAAGFYLSSFAFVVDNPLIQCALTVITVSIMMAVAFRILLTPALNELINASPRIPAAFLRCALFLRQDPLANTKQ